MGVVPGCKKYIAQNVALQWCALAANIAMIFMLGLFLQALLRGGAQGGIGGTTNYNGKELTGIIEAWKAGDLELARERQNFAQEVINVICHYRGNIVGGKRIMKLIGLDLGKNRTPFQNMTDEEEAAMKAELEAINFFERCNK